MLLPIGFIPTDQEIREKFEVSFSNYDRNESLSDVTDAEACEDDSVQKVKIKTKIYVRAKQTFSFKQCHFTTNTGPSIILMKLPLLFLHLQIRMNPIPYT